MKNHLPIICAAAVIAAGCMNPSFHGYKTAGSGDYGIVDNSFEFNGYTDHWSSIYNHQFRYGNLYKINVADVQKCMLQTRLDLADELGLPGLQMQEGFLDGLLKSEHSVLDFPTDEELKDVLSASDNVLVYADIESDMGKKLAGIAPKELNIGSYQRKAVNYDAIHAFMLEKGRKTIFAVVGDRERLEGLKPMIACAEEVIASYDMKRGWFGVDTQTQSVTCSPCNQLDVISRGMNEGNSWFVFNGLYEYISQSATPAVLSEAGCPAVIDFGSDPLYGADFSKLQVQLMFERKNWEEYKAAHGGYMSGSVPETVVEEDNSCDFYSVWPGLAKAVNQGTKPFVIETREPVDGLENCMVLFNKKGDAFNREKLWENIMNRRSAAVCRGSIIGDAQFRQTLQLLLLDRVFLEEYFGDRVNMAATVINDDIHLHVTNCYDHKLACTLSVNAPQGISVSGKARKDVTLAPGETRDVVFGLTPSAGVMGRRNAVLITAEWGSSSKMTIADYEMPPAVSVHGLLYGSPDGCSFPVSVHNITDSPDVDVELTVADAADPESIAFKTSRTVRAAKGTYSTFEFMLNLPQGNYTVTTAAMGAEAHTQLGIGSGKGEATLQETDIDGDGMNEYILENDKVRVTLIRTGARAIELYVKDRDDNVFFKLWPENPVDVNRAYRDRSFWPFGGFEDFLGQASAETHKIFDAEILKDSGSHVSVRMTGDLYGNIIEKTYTLYADSPMLEARFALDFINPEMDILGPQPILALGKEHWTEDRFYIPTAEGLQCKMMRPDRYYGSMYFPSEGWHSAYDTGEDISFIGAFPVRRPMYLHMWMNHPSNRDTHFYYAEFQPWITIEQGVTSYFTYYMWAQGGSWEDSLQQMKERNLITTQ